MWITLFIITMYGPARAAETADPGGGGSPAPVQDPARRAEDQVRAKYRLPTGDEYKAKTKASPGCARDYGATVAARPDAKAATPSAAPAIDYNKVINTALAARVPEKALRQALNYVMYNSDLIKNTRSIAIADFTKPGEAKRFFLVDTQTGRVEKFGVGQGIGTKKGEFDPSEPFDKFSNKEGSRLTGKGCMITSAKPYYGSYGLAYNLHGLNETNDQGCNRRTVMHPAGSRVFRGKSYGCLALDTNESKKVMARIGGGGIICTNPSS